MEKEGQKQQETLEALRGTEKALNEQLATARCAIAEMEARLAWSHSQISKLRVSAAAQEPPKDRQGPARKA